MFIKFIPGVQPGNSPIKRPLFEAHVLEGVLQQKDVLSGSLGRLEAVFLVDGPPHPPGVNVIKLFSFDTDDEA